MPVSWRHFWNLLLWGLGLLWTKKLLEVWPPSWRGAKAETAKLMLTVNALALTETQEWLQRVTGISPRLSTHFCEYLNRSPELRDKESLYSCSRPGRKQHRKGKSTCDSFSTKEELGLHWSVHRGHGVKLPGGGACSMSSTIMAYITKLSPDRLSDMGWETSLDSRKWNSVNHPDPFSMSRTDGIKNP